jgi:outer membrane protein TolC
MKWIGLLVLGATAALAQPATAPFSAAGPGAAAVPLTATPAAFETRVLTATELVHGVMLGNATARAARLQADAAGKLLDAERALYDPTAFGRVRRQGTERPRPADEWFSGLLSGRDTPQVAVENTKALQAGLRGKLPSGATFELSQDVGQTVSNLVADPREYRGTLTLTLKQPLLRGGGREATEADLRVAEREQAIEQQRFVKQMLDLVGEAAGTYWQLQRSSLALRMREEAVVVAVALRDEVQRRAAGGFAPRVDLLEAELSIGVRETDLVRARQEWLEAQSRVRNLLSLDPAAQPAVLFDADGAQPPAGDQALPAETLPPTQVLERWPAHRIAQLRLEQEQIRLTFARNQERPDTSVELSLSGQSLTQSLGSSVEDALRRRNPGWYAGVTLEMPLDNGAARSRRQAQALRVASARASLQAEALTAGNEWMTRRGQLQAALQERRQREREVLGREALVQAERESYELGRSRLRSLIEAQDRLADSRLRLLESQVRVELALLGLQAIGGDLLERFDVTVAP